MKCSLIKNNKEIPDAFINVSPTQEDVGKEPWISGHSPLEFYNYDEEEPLQIYRARVDYDVIIEARGNQWQDWLVLTAYIDTERAKHVKVSSSEKESVTTLTWTVGDNTYVAACSIMPLAGLTFVVAGTLPTMTHSEARDFIEGSGGRVTGFVSKKTDYLMLGKNPGSKLAKAQSLGIQLIGEEELRELANGEL